MKSEEICYEYALGACLLSMFYTKKVSKKCIKKHVDIHEIPEEEGKLVLCNWKDVINGCNNKIKNINYYMGDKTIDSTSKYTRALDLLYSALNKLKPKDINKKRKLLLMCSEVLRTMYDSVKDARPGFGACTTCSALTFEGKQCENIFHPAYVLLREKIDVYQSRYSTQSK